VAPKERLIIRVESSIFACCYVDIYLVSWEICSPFP
jgi:hypothetical protein